MKLWQAPSHSQLTVDVSMPAERATPDAVRGAVRELYERHARGLHVTLRRLSWPGADVDDLLHDTFVIALRRGRALITADSPKAWLYGIATRVVTSAGRKHRLRELLGLRFRPRTETTDDVESKDEVHQALAKLSAKKREVLVLFELQGLTGPEIAEALGCSLKTVWSRLHYARRDFEKQVLTDD